MAKRSWFARSSCYIKLIAAKMLYNYEKSAKKEEKLN